MRVWCVLEFVEGKEYDSWYELREIFDTEGKAREYTKPHPYKDFDIQEWEIH